MHKMSKIAIDGPKVLRVELVVWRDHEGLPGWSSASELEEWAKGDTTTCVSVGILVHEDDDSVVLSSSVHSGGWGDSLKLLKSSVVRREILSKYARPNP